MKTPKAEKLPSGNWRVKVQIDGKRYSCTAPTKKEAQDKAAKLYAGIQMEKRSPLTVGKAIDRYIELKSKFLSPTTIRSYKAMRKSMLKSIMDVNLNELTNADISNALNEDSLAGKSDKTIKNEHGLLSATLAEFRPDFASKPRLPKRKKKQEIVIPTEEEMKKIWNEAKGTKYELPILIASWMGLRESEVKGLKFSDIQNGSLHVQRALVRTETGFAEKPPKTISGDRWIKIPEPIMKLIEVLPHNSGEEYIIKPSASAIYNNLKSFCERVGARPCRFHDLRHFAASEMHSLGIPDKYISERMGHATDNMLRTVYEHVLRDKVDKFAEQLDNYLEEVYLDLK